MFFAGDGRALGALALDFGQGKGGDLGGEVGYFAAPCETSAA
jgi:hypothetical protein